MFGIPYARRDDASPQSRVAKVTGNTPGVSSLRELLAYMVANAPDLPATHAALGAMRDASGRLGKDMAANYRETVAGAMRPTPALQDFGPEVLSRTGRDLRDGASLAGDAAGLLASPLAGLAAGLNTATARFGFGPPPSPADPAVLERMKRAAMEALWTSRFQR